LLVVYRSNFTATCCIDARGQVASIHRESESLGLLRNSGLREVSWCTEALSAQRHRLGPAYVLLLLPREKEKEGVGMKRGSQFERFVPSSGRITLECGCGERVVLLGQEDDWYLEERRLFECACGERLTITNNRVGEEVTVAI
jgi:hypothetical protein